MEPYFRLPNLYCPEIQCHQLLFSLLSSLVKRTTKERIIIVKANIILSVFSRFYYDCVFRVWDRCNLIQDYIEIFDGWGPSAISLAHLCSGESIPEIISSGPEILLKFHTSPFGNPFHPLPLSYLPGFELDVQVCIF